MWVDLRSLFMCVATVQSHLPHHGVSDSEREPQRLPTSSQDELLAVPEVLVVADEESLASRLIKQLVSFQGCTNDAHEANEHEYEHVELHSQGRDCNSLSDLLSAQEPGSVIL
jgi:hypothetical protein